MFQFSVDLPAQYTIGFKPIERAYYLSYFITVIIGQDFGGGSVTAIYRSTGTSMAVIDKF